MLFSFKEKSIDHEKLRLLQSIIFSFLMMITLFLTFIQFEAGSVLYYFESFVIYLAAFVSLNILLNVLKIYTTFQVIKEEKPLKIINVILLTLFLSYVSYFLFVAGKVILPNEYLWGIRFVIITMIVLSLLKILLEKQRYDAVKSTKVEDLIQIYLNENQSISQQAFVKASLIERISFYPFILVIIVYILSSVDQKIPITSIILAFYTLYKVFQTMQVMSEEKKTIKYIIFGSTFILSLASIILFYLVRYEHVSILLSLTDLIFLSFLILVPYMIFRQKNRQIMNYYVVVYELKRLMGDETPFIDEGNYEV